MTLDDLIARVAIVPDLINEARAINLGVSVFPVADGVAILAGGLPAGPIPAGTYSVRVVGIMVGRGIFRRVFVGK